MIVIFEGCDKSGKTTIAKELSNRLFIPYFKKPNEHDIFSGNYIPEYSLIYETRKFLEFYESEVIKDVIIDRDYISEYVYGQIYRSKIYNELNINTYITEYDKRYYKNGCVIVYCYKNNYKNFTDEFIKENEIDIIKNKYEEFFNCSVNNILFLNTEDENLHNQCNEINNYISKINNINNLNRQLFNVNNKIVLGNFKGNKCLLVSYNVLKGFKSYLESKISNYVKFDNYDITMTYNEFIKDKNYIDSIKYYDKILHISKELNIRPNEISYTCINKNFDGYINDDVVNKNVSLLLEHIKIFCNNEDIPIITLDNQSHILLSDYKIKHVEYNV